MRHKCWKEPLGPHTKSPESQKKRNCVIFQDWASDTSCTLVPHEVGPVLDQEPSAKIHIGAFGQSIRRLFAPFGRRIGVYKKISELPINTHPHRGFEQPFGCLIDWLNIVRLAHHCFVGLLQLLVLLSSIFKGLGLLCSFFFQESIWLYLSRTVKKLNITHTQKINDSNNWN